MSTAFTCNLCEAMCGLHLTVEGGRITSLRANKADVFSRGHLCPKAFALGELLDDPDRLRQPLRRTASGWEKLGWDDALAEASSRLREVRRRHGRHAVAIYSGNPVAHTHRAAFGMQLLSLALGTHNRFDANSQDANPKLFAYMQMYGDGLALTVPDVDRTELFMILGGNPLISGGSLMALGDVRGRLHAIRARGGRVVVIDPRRTETAAFADAHHFLRPGGDAALLLSMLHVLFTERRVDEPAVRSVASGLDRLRSLALRFAPSLVGPRIGMAAATIRSLALELARPRTVIYGRIGTCQNEFGPLCAWLLEAINVVTGNFDVAGGAMFPEPAADPGALARLLIGNEYGRWRSRVRGLPEFLGSLPAATMAEEMEADGDGQIRALICLAGNPIASTPNSARLARAITKLDYRVSIDLYLNETSRLADLILPPLLGVQTGNFDLVLLPTAVRNFVKASPAAVPRPEGALDDWQILSELSLQLTLPKPLQRLLRPLLKDLPDRAVNLLLRRRGLSLEKLYARPDGIDLGPLRPARQKKIRTSDGRVRLCPDVFADDVPRLEKWLAATRPQLVLIGRRDLRTNNSWLHNSPSLAKGPDRSRLYMNPIDAEARGLADGASVKVQSRTGDLRIRLRITDEIMAGVVSLPHGFGHQDSKATLQVAGALSGANANEVTDDQRVDAILGTAALNGVPVEVDAT